MVNVYHKKRYNSTKMVAFIFTDCKKFCFSSISLNFQRSFSCQLTEEGPSFAAELVEAAAITCSRAADIISGVIPSPEEAVVVFELESEVERPAVAKIKFSLIATQSVPRRVSSEERAPLN